MNKRILADPKCQEFMNLASAVGFSNRRLTKCWFRSLRKFDRNLTPNSDLIIRFNKESERR